MLHCSMIRACLRGDSGLGGAGYCDRERFPPPLRARPWAGRGRL